MARTKNLFLKYIMMFVKFVCLSVSLPSLKSEVFHFLCHLIPVPVTVSLLVCSFVLLSITVLFMCLCLSALNVTFLSVCLSVRPYFVCYSLSIFCLFVFLPDWPHLFIRHYFLFVICLSLKIQMLI
jgi:hypothetical protein